MTGGCGRLTSVCLRRCAVLAGGGPGAIPKLVEARLCVRSHVPKGRWCSLGLWKIRTRPLTLTWDTANDRDAKDRQNYYNSQVLYIDTGKDGCTSRLQEIYERTMVLYIARGEFKQQC